MCWNLRCHRPARVSIAVSALDWRLILWTDAILSGMGLFWIWHIVHTLSAKAARRSKQETDRRENLKVETYRAWTVRFPVWVGTRACSPCVDVTNFPSPSLMDTGWGCVDSFENNAVQLNVLRSRRTERSDDGDGANDKRATGLRWVCVLKQ